MATGGEPVLYSSVIGSEDLDSLQCDPCQIKGKVVEAVGMCTTCQEYLCQNCFQIHTVPSPTINHELLTKKQLADSRTLLTRKDFCTEKCTVHTDEVIKYYCGHHQQVGCTACMTLHHKLCNDVQYISHGISTNLLHNKVYKDTEEKLKGLEQRAKQVTYEANQIDAQVQNDSTTAVSHIQNFTTEIKQVLKYNQAKLLKDVQEKTMIESDEVIEILEKVNHRKDVLQEVMDKIDELKRVKQHSNLFIYMVQIHDQLNTMQSHFDDVESQLSVRNWTIKFKPNNEILDKIKLAAPGRLSAGVLRVKSANYLGDITIKTGKDKRKCWITGSVLLPNSKSAVVADCYNAEIKTVDVQSGNVTCSLQMLCKPWDVALVNATQVAVTLPSKQQIAFLKLDQSLSHDRTIDVTGNCRGVDYRNRKLAVSFVYPIKVELLSLQGQVLQVISNQGLHFHGPYYLAFGIDTNILYVSNFISNTVIRLDVQKDSITAASSHLHFKRPEKVMVDNKYKAVYVCASRSNAIYQMAMDLSSVKELLNHSNKIECPYSISLNNTECEFYVGQRETDNLKVYQAMADF